MKKTIKILVFAGLLFAVSASILLITAVLGKEAPGIKTANAQLTCWSSYPQCNGECPPNFLCKINTQFHFCNCTENTCANSFPQCNGPCPPGQGCMVTGPNCQCRNECGTTYPQCNGWCVPGTHCVSVFGVPPNPDHCECRP